MSESIVAGDIVAVNTPNGKREGLVLSSHVDWNGRHIVEVQLDQGALYKAWSPTVTRVYRTVYTNPSDGTQRTVERRVY
ncbi:hypothetical protein BKA62DRAFT_354775 [Auriculariales sp. MPI-PUGE-AT-0066]|nr:hypothetical protein BKA62DRAFT_354775 [Auriculariales sp. MPI-PUGE-AT-0066]